MLKKLLVVGAVLLVLAGCLDAGQREAITKLEDAKARAEARLLSYDEVLARVIADIDAGKIPMESGRALIEKIKAERDADKAAVVEVAAALKAMKDAEVPWWGYIPIRELIIIGLSLATGKSIKTSLAERAKARAANTYAGDLALVSSALSKTLDAAKNKEYKKGDTLTNLLKVGASPALAERLRGPAR